MKNINEEIERIKQLFTEERLYGNLVDKKIINEHVGKLRDAIENFLTLINKNGLLKHVSTKNLEVKLKSIGTNITTKNIDEFIDYIDDVNTGFKSDLKDALGSAFVDINGKIKTNKTIEGAVDDMVDTLMKYSDDIKSGTLDFDSLGADTKALFDSIEGLEDVVKKIGASKIRKIDKIKLNVSSYLAKKYNVDIKPAFLNLIGNYTNKKWGKKKVKEIFDKYWDYQTSVLGKSLKEKFWILGSSVAFSIALNQVMAKFICTAKEDYGVTEMNEQKTDDYYDADEDTLTAISIMISLLTPRLAIDPVGTVCNIFGCQLGWSNPSSWSCEGSSPGVIDEFINTIQEFIYEKGGNYNVKEEYKNYKNKIVNDTYNKLGNQQVTYDGKQMTAEEALKLYKQKKQ